MGIEAWKFLSSAGHIVLFLLSLRRSVFEKRLSAAWHTKGIMFLKNLFVMHTKIVCDSVLVVSKVKCLA